jgi:hypothetical protein
LKVSTILKWVSGGLEALLGIPFLGGVIVLSLAWTPLFFMAALHIATLIFSVIEGKNRHGSILGIITSCIAWIPFVGMVMHIISAIILLIDAYRSNNEVKATY